MRKPCDHTTGPGSTLAITYSEHTREWAAGCTSCRRFTEYCLTKEEVLARARKGWWAK